MIKESIEEDVGKGQTPLIRAAESGDEYVVLSLLAARANIEHKDRSGRTALACAAGAKDPACMNLLLAAGSNISQANLRGQTPLHEAIVNGQEQKLGGCASNTNLRATAEDQQILVLITMRLVSIAPLEKYVQS